MATLTPTRLREPVDLAEKIQVAADDAARMLFPIVIFALGMIVIIGARFLAFGGPMLNKRILESVGLG